MLAARSAEHGGLEYSINELKNNMSEKTIRLPKKRLGTELDVCKHRPHDQRFIEDGCLQHRRPSVAARPVGEVTAEVLDSVARAATTHHPHAMYQFPGFESGRSLAVSAPPVERGLRSDKHRKVNLESHSHLRLEYASLKETPPHSVVKSLPLPRRK